VGGGDGAFADEEPEDGDGGEAEEASRENFAVGMVGGFEEPERGERA
jgi:hypothetical protein